MSSEVQYHYILDKGSKKQVCPACNKKTLVPYVDTDTGEILAGAFGRCDREAKCGYFEMPPPETLGLFVSCESIHEHSEKAVAIWQNGKKFFIPKTAIMERNEAGVYLAEYFLKDPRGLREKDPPKFDPANGKYFERTETGKPKAKAKARPKEAERMEPIPLEVLQSTLAGYEKNQFIQNLLQNVAFPFDPEAVEKAVSLYYLGTVQNGFRQGAITFPFIDLNNEIRAIQVKEFDNTNHTKGTGFIHSLLAKQFEKEGKALPDWLKAYQKNSSKVSCLFGEHLLTRYPGKPVALVEAPKTAIYGTLYFGFPEEPESFLWIAAYNKTSFNLAKMQALKGRTVFTFPDLSRNGNTFKEWQAKAKEIEANLPGTRFIFSGLLEEIASESDKVEGKDIADFLISLNWKDFRPTQPQPGEKSEKSEALKTINIFSNEQELRRTEEELGRIKSEIGQLEEGISGQRTEISGLEEGCQTMENTFIQIAKDCKQEWFGPAWIHPLKGEPKLKTALYYCE